MADGGHPQKGQNPKICDSLAQLGLGAKTYDAFGTACWNVYGMAIQINPIINSIMEGAMITNINFHTRSKPPAVSGVADLPGPVGATVGAPILNLAI